MRRCPCSPAAFLLLSAVLAPPLWAQQAATFQQPRIPEDVRRFESYYRAGVWRLSSKELPEMETRLRAALGLPPAAGTGAPAPAGVPSTSAQWDPAQFRADLQRVSQHFAAKMMPLGMKRANMHKQVKSSYLEEEVHCPGDKPDKCLDEAKQKACLRVEDTYQQLHNDWRNLLFDFYQTQLSILTENDEKVAALNPSTEARELAREWMAKTYEDMAARFVNSWGATLERQWGDYCSVPPAADRATSGWEASLRSPFPPLK